MEFNLLLLLTAPVDKTVRTPPPAVKNITAVLPDALYMQQCIYSAMHTCSYDAIHCGYTESQESEIGHKPPIGCSSQRSPPLLLSVCYCFQNLRPHKKQHHNYI